MNTENKSTVYLLRLWSSQSSQNDFFFFFKRLKSLWSSYWRCKCNQKTFLGEPLVLKEPPLWLVPRAIRCKCPFYLCLKDDHTVSLVGLEQQEGKLNDEFHFLSDVLTHVLTYSYLWTGKDRFCHQSLRSRASWVWF